MSVVIKALNLLRHFSTSRPEIGLSEFRRLAGHDKATTHRYLQALEQAGFIERIPTNRSYRIGPAVLHLAQMRELTVPRREGAQSALKALAEATGETAHISVLSGTDLHSLSSCESDKHSTRAIIDVNILPLHATASGICALAFGPAELTGFALNSLVEFTEKTAVTEEALLAEVKRCRDCGFGQSDRGFEDDICGISAPLFDQTGAFAGSIAVASVASRLTAEAERTIKTQLVSASRNVTRNWGGIIPDTIERSWANARIEA